MPTAFSQLKGGDLGFTGYAEVVPDNLQSLAAQFGHNAAAVYVGTGGHLSVRDKTDTNVLFKNVPSGTVLPITVRYVNSAGTTAADIVALFHE